MDERRRKKKTRVSPIYSVAATWALLSLLMPPYTVFRIAVIALASVAVFLSVSSYLKGKYGEEYEEIPEKEEKKKKTKEEPKSYGKDVDAIIAEGNTAQKELGRLYASIPDQSVKAKIRDIMEITDKIVQDAKEDPSDVPQIKKFFDYYLPTTIKLLNAYDRMGRQGIEGQNISGTMTSIEEMLETAVNSYKKLLDSLFANQAMDIETDISVMNTLLTREGLTGQGGKRGLGG